LGREHAGLAVTDSGRTVSAVMREVDGLSV
jgi:hypothetical protein